MNNRQKQKVVMIAGASAGIAGGVSAGFGMALHLRPVQYILLAVIIGVLLPVILGAIFLKNMRP